MKKSEYGIVNLFLALVVDLIMVLLLVPNVNCHEGSNEKCSLKLFLTYISSV